MNEVDRSKHIYIYFWIFGLVNNVLYVVILTAAVDIVGTQLPKSLVLLADILPSFLIKLISPFFIHKFKYKYRIVSLIIVSFIGMYMVSRNSLSVCLLGITFTSISSGFGEVTFLQLTHYYKETSLNGWSSGTGGAGLLGSGIYLFLTSMLGISPRLTLLVFSVVPMAFLLYFKLGGSEYQSIEIDYSDHNTIVQEYFHDRDFAHTNDVNDDLGFFELQILESKMKYNQFKLDFLNIVHKLKELFVPYMLPLTTVYLFEYLINQGIAPTLLFPIEEGSTSLFIHSYRDIYVLYGILYQCGVFISRSTAGYFRLRNLYMLSYLQAFNFVLAILQSWYFIIKVPSIVMALIFYEGLIGGSSYVNTFLNVLDDLDPNKTEFVLGATSIADSSGILFAAIIGLFLEPKLCNHQINDGRPWCQME